MATTELWSRPRLEQWSRYLNGAYLVMLVWWLVRTPRNLTEPSSYLILTIPFVCVYAARMRPFEGLAVIAGAVIGFVNLLMILVVFISSVVTGRGIAEGILVFALAAGNMILIGSAWRAVLAEKRTANRPREFPATP